MQFRVVFYSQVPSNSKRIALTMPPKIVKRLERPSKKKHYLYSEESLKRALIEIKEGRMSVRMASREFGVPKTTLQDHKSGKVPQIAGKSGPQPLLTVEGEKKLANWVITLAKCGFPVKKIDLLETVEAIVKNTDIESLFKNGRPGQKWYQNFLKRHPMISVREAESVNKARAIITEESIRAWFRDLKNYLTESKNEDILEDPDRILNGDEAGFSMCPKTGKVLAPRGWKNLYSIKIGNEKDNITVLIVFTASGKICPPLVLFPYVRPPAALVENMPSNWILGRSDSGWMKGDVFFEFIANDFDNWVTQNKLKRPILLLIDGHKSHMTMQLSEFCDQNGIILYALPPNTTHILQPADVSVFKPLKTEWKNTVRRWQNQQENVNRSVNKLNFCKVFQQALNSTDMTNHIKNGFRKCGLYPFNVDNVDYTKCVKNVLEQQNTEATPQTESEKNTVSEVQSAKKVIENLREKLSNKGVDVDLIMNEINSLLNLDEKTTSLVGATFSMEELEIENTIILEIIPPCSTAEDFAINEETDKLLSHTTQCEDSPVCLMDVNSNTLEVDKCTGHDNIENITSGCREIQSVRDSEDELINCIVSTAEVPSDEKTVEVPTDENSIEVSNNEIHTREDSDITSSITMDEKLQKDNKILYIPLDISFDKVLKYRSPNDLPPLKNKDKEKAPKAINSQTWRNFQRKKEDEKKEKSEAIKRRKEERQVTKGEKKKLKGRKQKEVRNDEGKENEPRPSKEKINCAACQADLNSDTEDEDNKNIGCDNCTNWFHLGCTEFLGLTYDEASTKDYKCFACS